MGLRDQENRRIPQGLLFTLLYYSSGLQILDVLFEDRSHVVRYRSSWDPSWCVIRSQLYLSLIHITLSQIRGSWGEAMTKFPDEILQFSSLLLCDIWNFVQLKLGPESVLGPLLWLDCWLLVHMYVVNNSGWFVVRYCNWAIRVIASVINRVKLT